MVSDSIFTNLEREKKDHHERLRERTIIKINTTWFFREIWILIKRGFSSDRVLLFHVITADWYVFILTQNRLISTTRPTERTPSSSSYSLPLPPPFGWYLTVCFSRSYEEKIILLARRTDFSHTILCQPRHKERGRRRAIVRGREKKNNSFHLVLRRNRTRNRFTKEGVLEVNRKKSAISASGTWVKWMKHNILIEERSLSYKGELALRFNAIHRWKDEV